MSASPPAHLRGATTVRPVTRPRLPTPVVPFAVGMRAPLRPDLLPLDRPVPDHVEDPGPASVLRLDAGTAALVTAKRRRLAANPGPWTARGDLPAARLRAAGRELAVALAREHPELLRLGGRALVLPGAGVAVGDDDAVTALPGAPPAPLGAGAAAVDGDTTATGGVAGLVAARLRDVEPSLRWLEALALAVGEDLVLVDRTANVAWLHVCAPTGWDPGSAGGAPLAALHGPVPHAERLRAASRALGRALVEGGPFVRWTWGLTADPALAHHARRRRPPGPPPPPGALTFRAERQTTMPLPETELGLFAIRVHRAPLARVVDRPERAEALAETVAALPEVLAAYKGVDVRRRELLTWLRETAPVASGT
jgi:hypothetical protein